MLESWGSSTVVLRGLGVQKSIFSLCQQTNTARVQFDVFWSLSLCGKWPQHQMCPWHLVWAPPTHLVLLSPSSSGLYFWCVVAAQSWVVVRPWWSVLSFSKQNKKKKKKQRAGLCVPVRLCWNSSTPGFAFYKSALSTVPALSFCGTTSILKTLTVI